MKLVVFFLSALRALVQQAPNSISTAHQSVAAVTEQLHYVKLRHVLYVTYTYIYVLESKISHSRVGISFSFRVSHLVSGSDGVFFCGLLERSDVEGKKKKKLT